MNRKILFGAILFAIFVNSAHAVPGDQLFVEDFETGVPGGWTLTVGPAGSWGVNAAFGFNAGYVAGDSEVRVTTPVADLSGVAGARIVLTVIRGKQTTIGGVTVSNKPENDENFELDFLDAGGEWQTVLVHFGGGTAGELFNSVVDLPSGALHAGFRLRFGTWGGDAWDDEPDDFWHFDDVQIIETGTAGGDLSACALGDGFESGLGNWTAEGNAAISGATYNSASNSLALPAGGSQVTSGMLDLAGKTGTVKAWIRAGGWAGGTDKPESNDHLEFQYQRSNGNWSTLFAFCNGCAANSTRIDVDAGGIALLDVELPNNALHDAFRLRIRNTSGSGSSTSDFWHVDNVCVTAISAADHFSIEHDGSAVNCQPEVVTIKAHAADHTVAQNYADEITLTTSSGHGDWSLAVGLGTFTNFGNGIATYEFNEFDYGIVALLLHNTYIETENINVGDGTFSEHVDEDPDLVFAATGFQFIDAGTGLDVGTQVAGKPSNVAPSNAIAIQAIRTSDETGACEAAFVGNTSVEVALSCETPASCAAAVGVVNGSNIATGNTGVPASWTTLNFDFGDKTVDSAPVVFRYDEAGGVKLHARKTLSPSGEVMAGSSNTFVVRPFGFDIIVDQGSVTATNPGATASTGTVFERAGNAFRVTARAVGWQGPDDDNDDGIPDGHNDADASNNADLSDNTALANFAVEATPDSVSLGTALVAPVGGNSPALAGTTTLTGFSSGASNSNDIVWGEAGIIEISAAIADNDYLGGGNVHGRSGYVGRFTPAWLESAVLSHGCNDTLDFTYSGQPLQSIRFTARSSAGDVVQNYDGNLGYAKDVTITEVNGLVGSVLNGTIAAEDFSDGIATITAAPAGIGFTFTDKESAPATAIFRATDLDSVTSSGHAEAQTEIRSARLVMTTVSSSLIADARSPMTIESFNAGAWLDETQDTCSTLDTSAFVLGAYSGIGDPQIDSGPSATFLSGGAGQFIMTTPGGTDEGSRLVTYDGPSWLEFDWNGSGNESPSATVTFFDLFNSEDGMIDMHEVIP